MNRLKRYLPIVAILVLALRNGWFGPHLTSPQGTFVRTFDHGNKRFAGGNTGSSTSPAASIAFLYMLQPSLESDFGFMWKHWYPPSTDMRYKIYAHQRDNKLSSGCDEFFCHHTLLSSSSVDERSEDFTFMMELLKRAYNESNATYFVFLGQDSMPLMSFDQIHRKITIDIGSSAMCINREDGTKEWENTYKDLGLQPSHLVKSSPLFILSRKHVKILIDHEVEMTEKWLAVKTKVRPEEAFFPSLLLREGGEIVTLCSYHYTSWDSQQPIADKLAKKECGGNLPCTFGRLYEPGMHLARKRGYMFLRKIKKGTKVESVLGTRWTLIDFLRRTRVAWEESQTRSSEQELDSSLAFDYSNNWCNAPNNRTRPSSILRGKDPSIAFLYLVDAASPSEKLWREWFPPKDDPRYHVYVHTEQPVDGILPGLGPFFCEYAIPSVPSKYYFLVEAMIQLISYSYHHSDATHFVFMSTTSIPLWNFNQVYDLMVTTMKESSFCFARFESFTWNISYTDWGLTKQMLRKAELWSVLTRDHVRILLENKRELLFWNDEFRKKFYVDFRVGAPDECLFSTMLHREGARFHDCSSIDIDTPLDHSNAGMGTCCLQHHSHWSTYSDWLSPDCIDSDGSHPCLLRTMNSTAIDVLSKKHMFLRKIPDDAKIFSPSFEFKDIVESLRSKGVLWNSSEAI